MLKVIHHRGTLQKTREGIRNHKVKLGFIGGSITESYDSYRSYSEKIVDAFAAHYPDVQLTFRNAGIGATGSAIGAFRVDDALLSQDCDLVFVEFAVNDNGIPTDQRNATREGLIRKLLKSGCDVAVVYTHCTEMLPHMLKGEVPPSIAEFEVLCEHYRLPSVWMGLYALRAVQEGRLRYEEWLPDRLHPETTGSSFYGAAVCEWLFDALDNGADETVALPKPLYTDEFERTHLIPLDELHWCNPWKLRSMAMGFAYLNRLETSAIGASIDIPFTGTGLVVVQLCGQHTAAMEASVDGGEPVLYSQPPVAWEGEMGHRMLRMVCRGLERGEHVVKLTNRFADEPGSIGTRLSIEMVGVIE